MEFVNLFWKNFSAVRQRRPLIHHLTNSVAANFSANTLLALGASPLMSHAPEELEEIVAIADALVLNIGTLDSTQIRNMKMAVEFANQKSIPIIIDPVGAGASRFRTNTARELLEISQNKILKGNASEILALADFSISSKGVDSANPSHEAMEAAKILIGRFQIETVVITGKDDFVLNREEVFLHSYGVELMTKVTGMGCMLSGMIAAFCTVASNATEASRYAVVLAGIAGEQALEKSAGPGSFSAAFIDRLFQMTREEFMQNWNARRC